MTPNCGEDLNTRAEKKKNKGEVSNGIRAKGVSVECDYVEEFSLKKLW